MVVEKQRFLYGSDVAAPTILNPAESENGSFCEYAGNRKSPVKKESKGQHFCYTIGMTAYEKIKDI